ncbi:hypothetical protein TNIN_45631 [Trichonephila inaurata madagascariensis]|uniref:Uncharacterized protein n=1 Tax=Trichonephila inaurata madagascariensis TaxID=2747483 RepID=A0A8X6X8J2_9ARAC|nr:hypothetical protein TNIN_45631 [Trichonephila inaurata madagascariensis]
MVKKRILTQDEIDRYMNNSDELSELGEDGLEYSDDDVDFYLIAWLKRSSFSDALLTRPCLNTLAKTLLESLGSESISVEIEEIGLEMYNRLKDHRGFLSTALPKDRLFEWVVTLFQFKSSVPQF